MSQNCYYRCTCTWNDSR